MMSTQKSLGIKKGPDLALELSWFNVLEKISTKILVPESFEKAQLNLIKRDIQGSISRIFYSSHLCKVNAPSL
jgi:hypothetical protein